MNAYVARHALVAGGWCKNVRLEIDASGNLSAVTPDSTAGGATPLDVVLPGMPNAHSHAFQRVVAGRTERAGPGGDSFWTWRSAMYDSLAAAGPDEFEAAAYDAYATMLAAGYTSVCEFHYVHHGPGGVPFEQPAEMAERIVAAARRAGIGLTLLPVLYRFSDFGERAPLEGQARFVLSPDAFATLFHTLVVAYGGEPDVHVGIALHSLRAVSTSDLAAIAELAAVQPGTPLHVHVSEQEREVEACRAVHGTTPIELLARYVELDERWALVHATHATASERALAAGARATVVLCPTTEANLGDGIFPAADFVRGGGRIAIGSDSNVTIDVAEELRWLEYVQRLCERKRNVLHSQTVPSVGRFVYESAAAGGARASGRALGRLQAGARADFVEFALRDFDEETALDALIFRSGTWKPRRVVAGGRLVYERAAHENDAAGFGASGR